MIFSYHLHSDPKHNASHSSKRSQRLQHRLVVLVALEQPVWSATATQHAVKGSRLEFGTRYTGFGCGRYFKGTLEATSTSSSANLNTNAIKHKGSL